MVARTWLAAKSNARSSRGRSDSEVGARLCSLMARNLPHDSNTGRGSDDNGKVGFQDFRFQNASTNGPAIAIIVDLGGGSIRASTRIGRRRQSPNTARPEKRSRVSTRFVDRKEHRDELALEMARRQILPGREDRRTDAGSSALRRAIFRRRGGAARPRSGRRWLVALSPQGRFRDRQRCQWTFDQLLASSSGPAQVRIISPPAGGHADGAAGMGRRCIATFTAPIRSPTPSRFSSIAGKADQE